MTNPIRSDVLRRMVAGMTQATFLRLCVCALVAAMAVIYGLGPALACGLAAMLGAWWQVSKDMRW